MKTQPILEKKEWGSAFIRLPPDHPWLALKWERHEDYGGGEFVRLPDFEEPLCFDDDGVTVIINEETAEKVMALAYEDNQHRLIVHHPQSFNVRVDRFDLDVNEPTFRQLQADIAAGLRPPSSVDYDYIDDYSDRQRTNGDGFRPDGKATSIPVDTEGTPIGEPCRRLAFEIL